jgi:hypothetical protein
MLVKRCCRALASLSMCLAAGCADEDAGRFAPDGTELAEYRFDPEPALSLSTDAITLSVNASLKLSVTHRDENGVTSDVSADAHWSSEDPTIAWVQQGKIVGVYPGLTQISVSYANTSTRVSVAVTTQGLQSIEIVPSVLEVPKGLSAPLRAFGLFRQAVRREITGLVHWQSSDSDVAVFEGNNVRGREVGPVSIEASLNDVTASSNVGVTGARLLDLEIELQQDTMAVGTSQQLRARGLFSDEQSVDVTDLAEWSSDDGNLASVDANGLASARSTGEVGFWARFLGQAAQVSVSIMAADQSP